MNVLAPGMMSPTELLGWVVGEVVVRGGREAMEEGVGLEMEGSLLRSVGIRRLAVEWGRARG
jgi:hypothetical protein